MSLSMSHASSQVTRSQLVTSRPTSRPHVHHRFSKLRIRAENTPSDADLLSDTEKMKQKKKEDAERLRAAEKFMVIGSGEASCRSCGYTYKPENGDPDYPVSRGTTFDKLPADWQCPTCGSAKTQFESKVKVVAGFAENQGYGLGTNGMTEEQKSLLIYGTLVFFFALFIGGYLLD